MDSEFIPLDALKRMMKLWWVIAAAGIIGGIFGLAFSRLHPPMFESQAIYQANLDFTKANQFLVPDNLQLSQADEDIALEAVHAALIKVEPLMLEKVNQQIPLTMDAFTRDATIERNNAFWIVRFRHTDPKVAQLVVSTWIDEATKEMQVEQQDGRLKSYVFFELISSASLPTQPLYNRTNQLVLAGGLIGLIIGTFLTDLPLGARFQRKQGQ